MEIISEGLENKIDYINDNYSGRISITGNNNTIKLSPNISGRFEIIIEGHNHNIEIGDNLNIVNLLFINVTNNNCTLKMGNNITLNDISILLAEFGNKVIIGDNCLFAGGIGILSTDYHSIVDKETNRCTNFAKNGIILEEHIWVGSGVSILKDSYISKDSVISASSLVKGKFEPNVVIGGEQSFKNWNFVEQ